MKKFAITAVVAAAMMVTSVAQAEVSATFNVLFNFTPTCLITETATETTSKTSIGDISIAYTPFGPVQDAGNAFKVRCSTALAYSLTLDNDTLIDDTTGLAYTLNLTTVSSATGATPNDSLPDQVGVATGNDYYVKVRVPAGQAGRGSPLTGTPNNQRIVMVAF
jgi:hypothetical protein